ncbi:MAG: DegT/DnrJ/EryC1/StrS family aminotransferase, partial [Bacteroidia bacterium]|nr:DegT/DnrJ/EryC1/StrS family aminotransferase [Bacteroidia bacterium]MDW8335175.1 DegT/DnrJ/EryC1/StrS family aminotransferase [Bacteroidia bacterium]
IRRAEIVWEKGTNRAAFWRGEVDKYNWVDVGSSFLASELTAAFLWAQLECYENIQAKRLQVWNSYREGLQSLEDAGKIRLPHIPEYASNNAHLFYILCSDLEERTALIAYLKNKGINAVFHYISLHSSPYYRDKHDGRELKNSDRYSDTLLRLPLYYEISEKMIQEVCENINSFYNS